jgi:hypothetical protein
VQVRDLAIDAREGELVAATHGRAFWILDNLALLEQLARQTSYSTASLQLFEPEAAWLSNAYGGSSDPDREYAQNPAYGAAVFFNVPRAYNGSVPLTLTFLDANGNTVRRFMLHPRNLHRRKLTPDQEADLDAVGERARELDDQTVAKSGMNLFQWGLRYAPAYDVPGFTPQFSDDWPNTADGPTVLPGNYSVELQYGAQTLRAPLEVRLDPRLHPTAGDLEARLALERRILVSIDALDRTIAVAVAARRSLPPARAAALAAAMDDLIQWNIHSSESDVLHTSKIREQLAFLLNSLETAYQRPTAAEYSAYRDLDALATAGEARLKALEIKEFP